MPNEPIVADEVEARLGWRVLSTLRWLFWRAETARILRALDPTGWGWRDAWSYAGTMKGLYFAEGYEPQEAVDEDRFYW